jgi:cytochrome P450
MTTAEPALRTFDLNDPALINDPYPTYTRIRAAGPIARGGPGQWIVARHADIAPLLRDPRLTKSLPEAYYRFSVGDDDDLAGFLARMNLGHRNRLASRLLAQSVSPGLVRRLGPHMASLVDRLLAPGLQRGRLDLVEELARPFPLMVICELLGIPESDQDAVWPRVAELVGAFSDVAFAADKDVSGAAAALRWLQTYLHALLAERRGGTGTDVLTRLAAAEEDGARLTDQEIVDNAITVFYAGFETSMAMISSGVVALLEHPDQLRRLRADRSLTGTAVEEILRYEAPIQVGMRAVVEPLQVGGQLVRRGRVLFLLVGSGNRDEAEFEQPDRLDIGRDPNTHLSFGAGVYKCLGANLARAEGAVLINRLLDLCGELDLAGEPVRRPRFNFRCFDRIPLAVRPA